MKTLSPAIWFLFATAASLAAADAPPAPIAPAPQPRLRLDRSKVQPEAKVESAKTAAPVDSSSGAILLDPVTVTDVKLSGPPQLPPAPDPKTFSVTEGGTLYRFKLGTLPGRLGIWRYTPIVGGPTDSADKVMFEFARLKF